MAHLDTLYAPHLEYLIGEKLSIIKMVDLSLRNKRVLIREDLNVPQGEDGSITDDTRIRASVPTIQHALKAGAKVILFFISTNFFEVFFKIFSFI